MQTQLADHQLEKIYNFLEKKYVPQIDLQYELADHIACKIEILQREDPSLSFEKALYKVYKSFGVYGFTKVRNEKMAELEKIWRSKMLGYLRSYFKLPKIIISILLSALLFLLLKGLADSNYSFFKFTDNHLFGFLLFILCIYGLYSTTKIKHRQKEAKEYIQLSSIQRAILTVSYTTQAFIFYFFYVPFAGKLPDENWLLLIISIALATSIIVRHATHVIYQTWYEEEKEQVITKYSEMRPGLAK